MKRLFQIIAPLVLTTLVFSCGGAGEDSGGSVSEEEFVAAFAEAFCGAVHAECMCEDPEHADEETCVTAESTDLQADQDAAQAAGLQYDAKCAGGNVSQWKAWGCKSLYEIDFDGSCDDACTVYYGDVAVDQPCMSYGVSGGMSDCASGLLCSGGVCYDPCGNDNDALDEGDACEIDGGTGGYCDYEAGLYCDAETMVCVKAPSIGQPCPNYQCAPGAVCDPTEMMCVAIPDVGEACTSVCASGAYCDQTGMVCVALPTVGEPCPMGQCELGASCDTTGNICVADEPFVCL